MRFETQPGRDDLAVLRLSEELNGHEAEALIHEAEAEINRGLRHLVVDCSRLKHVSSQGLGVLIRLHHRLRRRGGDVRLAGGGGAMAEALQMTRLDKVFDTFPSVDAALGAGVA